MEYSNVCANKYHFALIFKNQCTQNTPTIENLVTICLNSGFSNL